MIAAQHSACVEESPGSTGRDAGEGQSGRPEGKCHRERTARVRTGKGEKVR